MPKLMEKNGAEICTALVNIAGPIRNFLEDAEFTEAFRECTKRGAKNQLEEFLHIYADLMPFLFGEKHRRDTLTILAEVEGTTVKAMLRMNGAELVADALDAWKEQIGPFFQRLGVTT